MGTKFGIHVNPGPRNGYGEFVEAGPAGIVVVNEGGAAEEAKRAYPTVVTVGRFTSSGSGLYLEAPEGIDHWSPSEARRQWREVYAERFRAEWTHEGNQCDYYIVINEGSNNDLASLPAYLAYEDEAMIWASEHGFKLCVLNLAGGTPEDFEFWKRHYVPHIQRAHDMGHIYGRHAYNLEDDCQHLVPGTHATNLVFLETAYLRSIGCNIGVIITEVATCGGHTYEQETIESQVPLYDALCKDDPSIIAWVWFTVGTWNGVHGDANCQGALQWMTQYVASNPAEEWVSPSGGSPPTSPTPPENFCERPYDVVYALTPVDLTEEEEDWVQSGVNRGFELPNGEMTAGLHTRTYSADDCFVSVLQGQAKSLAIVIGGERIGTGLDMAWVEENYPSASWQTVFLDLPREVPDAPGTGYVYRGPEVTFSPAIHAPGSDWMWSKSILHGMLDGLGLPVKFMTGGLNISYFNRYHTPRFELTRVFWQPDRAIEPLEAYVHWKDHIRGMYRKGARHFELHNEPNLPQEGMGVVWGSGAEFGSWLQEMIGYIRADFPAIKLYYPGLSPQFGAQDAWTDEAWGILNNVMDGFCIHAYTDNQGGADEASNDIVRQVIHAQERLNLQVPIIVSECSVNRGCDMAYKAEVYRAIESKLTGRAGVRGVVYYISDWNPPAEQSDHCEVWLGTDLPERYLEL